MINHRVNAINDAIIGILPTRCGDLLWQTQLNGLGKIVWSSQDRSLRMHDQSSDWIVRDDIFDLQTCHLVDRIRKTKVESGIDVAVYTIECSLLGVSTKSAAGMLVFSAFKDLEWQHINTTDFDNNTERVLSSYWGIDREQFGQNPAYNAFRISYSYTLPDLDRDSLMALEGLNDID